MLSHKESYPLIETIHRDKICRSLDRNSSVFMPDVTRAQKMPRKMLSLENSTKCYILCPTEYLKFEICLCLVCLHSLQHRLSLGLHMPL